MASPQADESNIPASDGTTNLDKEKVSDGSVDSPEVHSADEKKDDAEPQETEMSKVKLILVLVALCMAVFLAALDAVIILPALPSIVDDFGAGDSAFAWIASTYLLALSATALFWGKVSDIFGRKPVLIIANVFFLVGSIVAATSQNVTTMIVGRAIQGTGAGGLIVLVEVSVGDMFSQRERGLFYGIYGLVWAVSTAIGPLIGGAFTSYATWRWCFWINVPFDGISLIMTFFFLHIHNPKTPLVPGLKAIDWVGSVLVVGATLMFLLGLDFGGREFPWSSATVICLLIFGVVTYVAFFVYERYARYPITPGRLFNSTSLIATFVVVFTHGACFMAPCYFIPFYFQTALGATPILSGVWFLPLAFAFIASGIIMGMYIKKTGKYLWIIQSSMGLLTLATGLLILFDETRNWAKIVIFQILLAWGIGANMQTLVICIQALVAPGDIGVATSTLNFVRNLATSISVVIGEVTYGAMLARSASSLRDSGIPADTVDYLVHGGSITGGAEVREELTDDQADAYTKAIADALSYMWIVFTCISFVGFAASFFISKKELLTTHEVTKTGLAAEEEKRQQNLAARDATTETAVDGGKVESV